MQKQPVTSDSDSIILLQKQNESLAKINQEQHQQIAYLKQELAQLKRMIFGQKRERFMPEQNAQMSLELQGIDRANDQPQTEQVSYQRNKPGKKGKAIRLQLPAHLPRERTVIDVECLEAGAKKIGEHITEIAEYIPGKLFVKQYVRPKYVQGETILIAPLPTLPIPQGNAGPGLLAHLLISKFVDHLPFYRQVQQFKREGVKIAESTISGWFTKSCQLLEPLYGCLREKIQQSDYLNADETPIPVQSSYKKGATHTGYHWVYHAPLQNMVYFDYRKGRGREGPQEFLKDFKGALQTDGYAAYEIFNNHKDVTLLACMAHARRYFDKATDNDKARAEHALELIQQLYAVERRAKQQALEFEHRYQLRIQEAVPVLDTFHHWLKENMAQVLPKSAIGKAIAYSLKLWPRLIRYTENGKWSIDNNLVENSIRPLALGRKNYLFAGSHQAAKYADMLYSFLGTCKMNDINPFDWLKYTLEKIPDTKLSQLNTLLPLKDNFDQTKLQ